MSNSQQEKFARMALPGEEHKKLDAFVGTFRGEAKIWMGPGDPHVSTGTMVNKFELGRRFLHQDYKGDASEGPFPNFEGQGYWGFNNVTGRWGGFWIDTASTMMMQTETGDLDESGKVWTMVGTVASPDGSGDIQKRSVITLIDGDHHSMEMFFDSPAGEYKAMEIRYERAG